MFTQDRHRCLEFLVRHVDELDALILVSNRSPDVPEVDQLRVGRAEFPKELLAVGQFPPYSKRLCQQQFIFLRVSGWIYDHSLKIIPILQLPLAFSLRTLARR